MTIPFPMPPLIERLDMGPLEVERRAPPTRGPYGDTVPAAATLSTLSPVTWHSVEGRELEQLPEADRVRELRKFYTLRRLYTATDGQAPDVILQGGRRWRVVLVENYLDQGDVCVSVAALEPPQVTS